MRIPGIQSIAYIACHELGSEIEMEAMAGITPSITPYLFTPVIFTGDPTLELSDSNEHNGQNRSAALNFITPYPFTQKRVAFLVTAANGAIYLIGGATTVPAISTKDTTANAGTINATAVSVELNAAVAWIKIEGEWHFSEAEHPVGYLPYRVITDQEIDGIVQRLKEK